MESCEKCKAFRLDLVRTVAGAKVGADLRSSTVDSCEICALILPGVHDVQIQVLMIPMIRTLDPEGIGTGIMCTTCETEVFFSIH